VADRLVAWLYDTPVAVLLPGPEFRIQLEWRPEGIERWGLGSPVLSERYDRHDPADGDLPVPEAPADPRWPAQAVEIVMPWLPVSGETGTNQAEEQDHDHGYR
jgi:hypothetical protein